MLVNICMKFHEDALNGFKVAERTRFCLRNCYLQSSKGHNSKSINIMISLVTYFTNALVSRLPTAVVSINRSWMSVITRECGKTLDKKNQWRIYTWLKDQTFVRDAKTVVRTLDKINNTRPILFPYTEQTEHIFSSNFANFFYFCPTQENARCAKMIFLLRIGKLRSFYKYIKRLLFGNKKRKKKKKLSKGLKKWINKIGDQQTLFMFILSDQFTVTRKTGKHLMTGKRRKTPENTKILQENTKEKFIYSVMV